MTAAGCGGEAQGPTLHPVSGTVTYKGAPVANVQVSFVNEAASRYASGTTDAEGKFQLMSFKENDGAIAGEHVVLVSKQEVVTPPAGGDPPSMDEMYKNYEQTTQKTGDGSGEAGGIPAKYATVDTSPLKQQVSADGPNEATIELED
jgi:hypothetical protein